MQIISGHVWLFSSYLNKDLKPCSGSDFDLSVKTILWLEVHVTNWVWRKWKILIKMTDFKKGHKILRSQGANSLIWMGVAGNDRGRVDQFAAEDVWKGNQLMQIPCMCSPWDKHLSSSAVLLAALALIYCSSEWAAFAYYVMFSVWVEAEVPHHCSAKTLSTQIMFILGSSRDFTVDSLLNERLNSPQWLWCYLITINTFFFFKANIIISSTFSLLYRLPVKRWHSSREPWCFKCCLVIWGRRALCVLCLHCTMGFQ